MYAKQIHIARYDGMFFGVAPEKPTEKVVRLSERKVRSVSMSCKTTLESLLRDIGQYRQDFNNTYIINRF